jgi:hypothetical protein
MSDASKELDFRLSYSYRSLGKYARRASKQNRWYLDMEERFRLFADARQDMVVYCHGRHPSHDDQTTVQNWHLLNLDELTCSA